MPALPDNDGTALYQAFQLALGTQDRYLQASLFARQAQAWSVRGKTVEVGRLLALWAVRNDELGTSRERLQLDLELARSALEAREVNFALGLLNAILPEILKEKNTSLRSTDLVGFIQVCFMDTVSTALPLRRAIQQIYIIDDLWLRVYLLTELAGYYESNEGKRAGNFLQQAVPAALGIDNPFLKAEAFAILADGLTRESLLPDANDQIGRSIETILDQEILSLSREDGESLTRTLQVLVRLGRHNEVAGFTDLVPDGQSRAAVFESLARAYLLSGQVFPWRLAVQRMISTLGTNHARVLFHLGRLIADLGPGYPQELTALVRQGSNLVLDESSIEDAVLLEFSSKIRTGGFLVESDSLRELVANPVLLARTLLAEWPGDKDLVDKYSRNVQALLAKGGQGSRGREAELLALRLLLDDKPGELAPVLAAIPDKAGKAAFILEVYENLKPGSTVEADLAADLTLKGMLSQ